MTKQTPSTGKANLTLWTGRLLFLFELSLSVPISAAIEDATGFATPGPLLAHYIVGTPGRQGLGALIVCGIGIDATLCCGMIWGLHVLGHSWMQFRRELAKGADGQPPWSHSTQRAKVLFAAILCGPFLSYYVAFLAAKGLQFDCSNRHHFLSVWCWQVSSLAWLSCTRYMLSRSKLGLGISFNERA